MNVRELIRALLIECGKDKRAEQIYKELKDNEIGNTEVGADVDNYSIRYVEKISNEFPTYIGLVCERIVGDYYDK